MFRCLLDETCFDPAKHETYLRPCEIRVLKYGLAQRRPDFLVASRFGSSKSILTYNTSPPPEESDF